MRIQCRPRNKILIANMTLVRLLASMTAHMNLQRRTLPKRFTARPALERLLLRMNPTMTEQILTCAKTLTARLAHVRFLALMIAHMRQESRFACQRSAANIAHKPPAPLMNIAHMPPDRLHLYATDGARMILAIDHFHVRFCVLPQIPVPGVLYMAHVARVPCVRMMPVAVLREQFLRIVATFAMRAHKSFFSGVRQHVVFEEAFDFK